MEHVIFAVKEKMKCQSRGLVDSDIVKAVGSLSVESKLVEHHRLCVGMTPKTKQHAHDMIGRERVTVMMERISHADPFSSSRKKISDFVVKPNGSPFHGMDMDQLNRFGKRQRVNYQRSFPA